MQQTTPARRALGATGLTVSRLGLGLAALGRPGYINLGHATDLQGDYAPAAMEARAHRVLDAAWAAGMRYFDAARSYGRAEAFLGSWLAARGIAPAEAVVGSKWGYRYTADWQVDAPAHEIKEHSAAMLERQWGESRALLGAHLDLYQIHSATFESRVLENAAVLDGLWALKRTGIRIGLSVSGTRQPQILAAARALRRDGQPLFDCAQLTWNPLETSVEEAAAAAAATGMGIIVKEALANGRLTGRNTDPAFAVQRAVLETQARRLGVPMETLVLAAALERPWADVVLSGVADVAQLDANLAALDVRLDAEARAALANLTEPPEDYWQRRAALTWN
ncbi:aldo/keto reductase [Ectothiorhodospiraceae bacterium 2226]|nr:aldo/keto reductase [Ectothiorhodospiraceae bacterium 2226]